MADVTKIEKKIMDCELKFFWECLDVILLQLLTTLHNHRKGRTYNIGTSQGGYIERQWFWCRY